MNFEKHLDKHHNCRVVLVDQTFKDRQQPVPTLYCADHIKWIKFCSHKEAEILKQAGVEDLGLLKI